MVVLVFLAAGPGLWGGAWCRSWWSKRELGWRLRYPSWRQGFKEALS